MNLLVRVSVSVEFALHSLCAIDISSSRNRNPTLGFIFYLPTVIDSLKLSAAILHC